MGIVPLLAGIDRQDVDLEEVITLTTPLKVGSSEWWLLRLLKRLDARQPRLKKYQDYYDGETKLEFASQKFREAFGGLFTGLSDNVCVLVVDAVRERLRVEGFRMGGEADPQADKDAWRIWQANQLDAESQLAHKEALISGAAYIHISPFSDDWINAETPLVAIETGEEVIVETARGSRHRRAALKRWIDDDNYVCLNLFLPAAEGEKARIEKYVSENAMQEGDNSIVVENSSWRRRVDDAVEEWPLYHNLGVVPIIPLVNSESLRRRDGKSEIHDIIPLQDGINKSVADLLLASEFASFRQRYGINLVLERDSNGNLIEPYKVGVDRMWVAKPPENPGDPAVEFGEFEETNLQNIISEVEMFWQHVGSISRTPPHYLLKQSGAAISGESLKSTETGLVAKVRDRQLFYGESWEEALRLCFRAMDDPRGEIVDSETIWGDPESRSEAEHTDAQVKQRSVGVPEEAIWESLGRSPQEIARFKTMREDEARLAAMRGSALSIVPDPTNPKPPAPAGA